MIDTTTHEFVDEVVVLAKSSEEPFYSFVEPHGLVEEAKPELCKSKYHYIIHLVMYEHAKTEYNDASTKASTPVNTMMPNLNSGMSGSDQASISPKAETSAVKESDFDLAIFKLDNATFQKDFAASMVAFRK